jgi:hypothetical protein
VGWDFRFWIFDFQLQNRFGHQRWNAANGYSIEEQIRRQSKIQNSSFGGLGRRPEPIEREQGECRQ